MLGTQRSTVRLSTIALVCTAFCACGGDLRGRYDGGPAPSVDGGLCRWQGQQVSCDCKAEALSVAVVLGFASTGTLNAADVSFARGTNPPRPTALPAKGSSGASGYLVASLRNTTGTELATLALADPRGPGRPASRLSFALPAAAAPAAVHVENWGTGEVILDLDLRGHLQLVCIDRPCLSICSGAGVDAGSVDAGSMIAVDASGIDAGIVDAPAGIDGIDVGGID